METVKLGSKDFATGTYIVTKPGIYKLEENIIFAPNSHHNFYPEVTQTSYHTPKYCFGFYTAISIESDDVMIDLNRFEISQDEEFSVNQGDFTVVSIKENTANVVITNGTIGRSSGCGIGGDRISNIVIKNVTIKNYQRCGIEITNYLNVLINECKLLGVDRKCLVNSKYWIAKKCFVLANRFLINHGEKLPPEYQEELIQKLQKLENSFSQVRVNGDVIEPTKSIYGNLSKDPVGLSDMQCSGISLISDTESMGLVIKNTFIRDTTSNVIETVGISGKNSKIPQRFPDGSIFPIEEVLDSLDHYSGNILTDCQIFFSKCIIKSGLKDSGCTIEPSLIDWTEGIDKFNDFVANNKWDYLPGLDIQGNYVKGNVGLNIKNAKQYNLNNIEISVVINQGLFGSTLGNPNKYYGFESCGIRIEKSDYGDCRDVAVEKIASRNGSSFGIQFLNSHNFKAYGNCEISKIQGGQKIKVNNVVMYRGFDSEYDPVIFTSLPPNGVPNAFGLYIDPESSSIRNEGITVSAVDACGIAVRFGSI